jgi:hypothetical protein
MFVYRANMKLQKHSEDLSQNQYMCYKLKRNGEVRMPKQTECKVFIFYSLYAWGLSVIITAASMVMDFMPTIPSSYLKPNFGDNKCWFSSKWHDFVSFDEIPKITKLTLPRKLYPVYISSLILILV